MTIRVLLVDDHALVLAGIRALVQRLPDVQVVAGACDGREAVTLALLYRPDLIVMDVSMRNLNGIDATAQIMSAIPSARVLILSSHKTEDVVRRAMKAGATGYLVKESGPQELGMAIEAAMRGDFFLSPYISKHLVSVLIQDKTHKTEASLDLLTHRQREVLQLIAERHSTKQIAVQLNVSVKTVETHRAAVMQKLGIRDFAGLVIFALRAGLVNDGSLDEPMASTGR